MLHVREALLEIAARPWDIVGETRVIVGRAVRRDLGLADPVPIHHRYLHPHSQKQPPHRQHQPRALEVSRLMETVDQILISLPPVKAVHLATAVRHLVIAEEIQAIVVPDGKYFSGTLPLVPIIAVFDSGVFTANLNSAVAAHQPQSTLHRQIPRLPRAEASPQPRQASPLALAPRQELVLGLPPLRSVLLELSLGL